MLLLRICNCNYQQQSSNCFSSWRFSFIRFISLQPYIILLCRDIKAILHQSTMDEFFDQLNSICNIFVIYFSALNRVLKLNKKWKYPTMIYVLYKSYFFFLLHFFIIIGPNLVDKHNKCWNKILEIIEIVRNLNNMPPVFLNPLQSKFHSCIIIPTIYHLTVFQKNIRFITCTRNFCNKQIIHINYKLFFLSINNFH